ncbi:MAG: iron-containing alcohol dehydrogenase, partial [Clostridium sp.]|nr:iron-containing alcohol dehydrogenase [Clostridium sp.]
MNNFIFENSTKVYFGKGCVKEYLACLTKKYGENVMLCYGGGSIKKNGIYDEVTEILKDAGKTVFEFSGIMPNPTYNKVLEGAELAREHKISLILGVGGGSVIDCCKAISLAARYD